MYLDPFHTDTAHQIRIAAPQASRFAKEVAGDFNPIHDPQAKRFCVPGDLLFALVLAKYGLSQRMTFIFKGMVGHDTPLDFTPTDAAEFDITGGGKTYMSVAREGAQQHDPALIEELTRNYVAFSGRNFPHTIQPLLEEQQVMLNPERPLVIYERMLFELDRMDFTQPELHFSKSKLEVNGKRGEVHLNFTIHSGEEEIGRGSKRLLVSGLIPYDAAVAEQLVADYMALRSHYQPVMGTDAAAE